MNINSLETNSLEIKSLETNGDRLHPDNIQADNLQNDPRPELITSARYFYHQGWMLGTGGNLSAKLDDGSFWVTASGQAKGELTLDSFVRIYADGTWQGTIPTTKPSAETSIHQAIYQLFPEAQACFHVHSVEANLVSRFVSGENLPLPNLEMVKGLGIWAENPNCLLPLFTNHYHVPQIASDILTRFNHQSVQLPALLIRDHGVTVWANSLLTARNYIEVIEYIFRFMVSARHLGL